MQEADKIQYKEVATWLRWNVKVKTAPFKGRLKEIDSRTRVYFYGQKAVDKLMDSNFHKKNQKGLDRPLIPDRSCAITMLKHFMEAGLFIHVEREYLIRRPTKVPTPDSETESESDDKVRHRKKKKYRLELSKCQTFEDDPEAIFMWDFDPTHPYAWFYGSIIIIMGLMGFILHRTGHLSWGVQCLAALLFWNIWQASFMDIS